MAKPALARVDESKRQRIFEVAAREFARRGFYGASVDEVARGAGIAKGAVYLYFESKLDLYKETLRAGARLLDRLFEQVLGQAESFTDRLSLLYRLAEETVAEGEAAWRMYCDLVNSSDPDLAPMATELEASSSAFYRRLVEDGRRAGEVRDDLPVAVLAYLLDNMFVQFFAASVSGYQGERLRAFWPESSDPGAELRREIDSVLDFVRSGALGRRAAAGAESSKEASS